MEGLFRENRLIFNIGGAPTEGAGTPTEPEVPKKKTLADYGIVLEKPDEEKSEETESKEKSEDSSPEGEPDIPERPKDALTGSQFGDKLKSMEADIKKNMKLEGKKPSEIAERVRVEREKAIYQEIKKGNIPSHLRKFKEVTMNYENNKGETISATIKVMPDYIAIGNDEDSVRVPMTPYTAQLIARQWKCTLPTTKMVDEIAKQANVQLRPSPKPPGIAMMGTDYFLEHNKTIQEQLNHTDYKPGDLVDGNKKDIVIPEQGEGSTHVVIYGWHNPNGSKIQGYSHKAHENTYADYSHGVRLVANYVKIEIRDKDGKVIRTETKRASDVMADKYRYFLLSKKPMTNTQTSYSKSRWSKEISDGEEPPAPEISKTSDEGIPIDQPSTTPTSIPTTNTSSSGTLSGGGESAGGEGGIASGSGSRDGGADTPNQNPPPTSDIATTSQPEENSSSSTETDEQIPISGNLPPIKPASSPAKYLKENAEPPHIKGKTAFFGDSINTEITKNKFLKGQGHKEYAMKNKTTTWLRDQVKKNADELAQFENAVVLIGTNDIGIGGEETPEVIFARMKEIWTLIKIANPNIKLYACTIPPFGKYKNYTKNKDINARRIEINKKIRKVANEDPSIRLIDLCRTLENGGLADSEDDNVAALHSSVSYKRELLHPEKEVLARTYARAMYSYEEQATKTDST